MTSAVRTAAGYAFDQLRLRRIEAACVPGNAPSRRLLEKVGFLREGYAREYLCINGVWQDHVALRAAALRLPAGAAGGHTLALIGCEETRMRASPLVHRTLRRRGRSRLALASRRGYHCRS